MCPENTQRSSDALRSLTSEEQALYDRQIRLWGEDAQRRLSASKVLLICDTATPLAQELAKNVLLAGIAQLVLQPLKQQSKSESEQLNSGRGFLGTNAAEVIDALKEMNPLVNVTLLPVDVSPPLLDFRVVCVIGATLQVELEISQACRAAGVVFLSGRTCGEVGWFFVDAGDNYAYTVGEGTNLQTDHARYISYRHAIDAMWGGEVRRAQFGWHVARTLLEFERIFGHLPQDENDLTKLDELYITLCKERSAAHVRSDIVKQAARAARFVLPPIAGIVGGLWGRETVKIISGKGAPLDGNNLFFFNAATSIGAVERVGYRRGN